MSLPTFGKAKSLSVPSALEPQERIRRSLAAKQAVIDARLAAEARDPLGDVVRHSGSIQLLTPAEVAKLLGVGVRTLERWRGTGEGPRFIALSRKSIRYTEEAVRAFVGASERSNTAE